MEPRALLEQMRQFSFALDVRCEYCHVGEAGISMLEFDFASDEKEPKRQARTMLRMVAAINDQHLPGLGKDAPVKVECVTCHRGVKSPAQLEDVLVTAARDGGADAAIARYRELRESYYGSHSYDFSDTALVRAAEVLLAEDLGPTAIALLTLNHEQHPESQWTLSSLARAHHAAGNTEQAIQALETLLELSPDNERVKAQLEQLRAAAGDK